MYKIILLTTAFLGSYFLSAASPEPVRIMPLGDSITFGYASGLSTYNGYRKTLKALLDDNGYSTDFVGSLSNGDFSDNQHEGHNGWYADHLTKTNTILSHVAGWLAENPADIVLLHIGSNDVNDNNEDANEVSDILDEIYAANSNVVVVMALIINAHADYTKRTEISTYNTNLNLMAQNRIQNGDALIVVDMENGAGIDYTNDMIPNLHPNQIGYDKMATNWYPAVVAAIDLHMEKRAPVITSITVSGTTVSLAFDNLSTGCMTHVERNPSLQQSDWSNQWSFVPASTVTNWTDSQVTTSAFYRIVLP